MTTAKLCWCVTVSKKGYKARACRGEATKLNQYRVHMENSATGHECVQDLSTVSLTALIPVITLSTLAGLAAVVLNVLVIWAVYRNPTLRSVTNYWIVSLAVADLLIAILGVPVWCLRLLHKAELIKAKVHNLFTVIVVLTLSSSSLNLLALSYDRFIGVISPFQYHTRLNRARCGKIIASIWILSLSVAFASLQGKCTISPLGHFVLFTGIFGIPFLLMGYIYFRIFKEAQRQKRMIKTQMASSSHAHDQPSFLRENKAAMTVAMVTGSFALCWLPSWVDSVLHLASPTMWNKTQVWLAATTLACFTPVINPIVYSMRIESFRNTFRTVAFKSRKGNSVNVPPM